ncbi:MAG: outer membrane protein assembly factor BamD [Gemmatimonadaceae bacterium]|nr:outer membrane protein assembly factor BamD [Gemmatimonadaceae bacterium]
MNVKRFLVLALLAAMACRPAFNAGGFASTDDLYQAAMKEYNAKRWENAVHAFERLTTELSPRDPRIATAYLYLGKSQQKQGDHLLAAKSYSRIYELLPQDTLADDALLASGLAYEDMWRKPVLDAEYGDNAMTQFQSLVALYPDSPLVPRANAQLVKLDEWFAEKDFLTGYHYLKRKAYDSAIIYFKDVIRLHPNAKKTREAYLRLHEAYKAINYKDDARDLCDTMRKTYPSDRDVRDACGPAPAPAASQ